jgi:hypothetical protein
VEENKIKPTIPIPTEARLVFSKLKSIEFSGKIISANLNGYEIFVVQLVHIQDPCGNGSHFSPFCGMSLVPLIQLLPYSFGQICLASRYGGAVYALPRSNPDHLLDGVSAILVALSRYTSSVFGKENRPLAF